MEYRKVKSYVPSPEEVQTQTEWVLFDADGLTLGRLASEIAKRLKGKHKPNYTPFLETGDNVVVINAAKVGLTGKKLTDKIYYSHSRYAGGLKKTTAKELLEGPFPERVIEHAVRGMLPKNRIGRSLFRKLKVYGGSEHPHQSQNPTAVTL
ncbi:MAG: 50S ribosomal protein L13 [Magnetococcales bacterium]|nr:50S ribosomal protein L13 [Magnetococcales bacterium]